MYHTCINIYLENPIFLFERAVIVINGFFCACEVEQEYFSDGKIVYNWSDSLPHWSIWSHFEGVPFREALKIHIDSLLTEYPEES